MPTCFPFALGAEGALLDSHKHRCPGQRGNQDSTTWHDVQEARRLSVPRNAGGTIPSRTFTHQYHHGK